MHQTEVQKIKVDIMKIINGGNGSMCLCGHGEWCDTCSTSPKHEDLKRKLKEYLNTIK